MLALLAFGLLMVQSASTSVTADPHFQWSPLGMKDLIFVALSIPTYFIVGRINYQWIGLQRSSLLKSPIFWMFILSALACALVLVPHIGSSVNGARRWLKLGPIQFQPSELAKWAAVLFMAFWLTRPRANSLDAFFLDFTADAGSASGSCLCWW